MWAFVLKWGCLRNPRVLSARSQLGRRRMMMVMVMMMMMMMMMIMTMIMAAAVMLVMMMMIMMMIYCCLQKWMLVHWCGWQKRCWWLFMITVDIITMCSPCIDCRHILFGTEAKQRKRGKRVCGATMTSDGFGRWAVPSARDLADVMNMVISSNHSRSAEHDYILTGFALQK